MRERTRNALQLTSPECVIINTKMELIKTCIETAKHLNHKLLVKSLSNIIDRSKCSKVTFGN